MSDIGFYGIEAALVGLAMLVVAGIGLLVETVLRRKGRTSRDSAALAFVPPSTYGLLALGLLAVATAGSLDWRSRVDDVAWLVASAGLVVWGVVRLGVGWRGRERN